ncbi:MAG: hypothetical protein ACJAT3_001830, partial [Akkermansiaceae bacterium]
MPPVKLRLFSPLFALLSTGAAARTIDFNRDVRPILSDNCFACHGFDAASRKADLRLDTRDGAVAEVIVPGKPEASELIARVKSSDPDEVMPNPESHKKPLSHESVATLETWIRQGAAWGDHWAFVAPKKEPVPKGSHAIDHFVAKGLEEHGLKMSAAAEAHTIRRRMAFDLTGLPPTLEQLGLGFDQIVDHLLAS